MSEDQTTTTTTNDPSQGSSHQGGELKQALEAKAKAEADLASLREGVKKKRDADARAAKAEEDEAAKKRGEFDRILQDRDDQLSKANERIAAIDAATVKRIDTAIEQLPEAAKAEIALIRDGISLEKLEEYVNLKLTSVSNNQVNTLPSPSPSAGNKIAEVLDESTKIMNESKTFIEDLGGTQSTMAMTDLMKSFPVGGGKEKWRVGGTGDDDKDTRTFIGLMRKIGHNPWRDLEERRAARLAELKKDLGI
jgi:hypothetical protein